MSGDVKGGEESYYKKHKDGYENYRSKVLRFTFQLSVRDAVARDWFERQPEKGTYLKRLILEDRHRTLGLERGGGQMQFPSTEVVKQLRADFPVGARVELVRMDDTQAPPVGTLGTVRGVDDAGHIMVAWDSGGSLSVIYGIDECRRVPVVKTVCYGKTEEWYSRDEAIRTFYEGVLACEGSERDRYMNVYCKLKEGRAICTDEDD